MFGFLANKTIKIRVEGMTCEGCTKGVHRALSAVKGVREVSVDLKNGIASVTGKSLEANQLIAAVDQAGFKGFAN